uniref:chloride channel protein n=1 Tax=Acetatifactor sp. TaxID=1872090 RepID=UPI004056076E
MEDIFKIKERGKKLLHFVKWVVVSGVIGVVVGIVGSVFGLSMEHVTALREEYPRLLLGLPAAGVVIVFLYHIARRDHDKGTNGVLAAVRSEERLPIVMAPLIFVSTLFTHLFGGSSGREGAALQLGGSIGGWFGKLFHMDEADEKTIIMCGMSACFSALFGTPMAAAIFAMEVVNVGVMYYAAFVPCVFASLVAAGVAHAWGVHSEAMTILEIPELTMRGSLKIMLLALLCAVVSIAFCKLLHTVSKQGKKWFPNPYLRVLTAGVAIVIITANLQTTDYMGAGIHIIQRCITEGEGRPEAFLIKMILTALTLGAGYKGGEIVPSFFIGASFGCLVGEMVGLSPSLCAAVGMIAVFCGVTNSPITALLIALELFGMDAFPYFILAIAISYRLSGYSSLYSGQKILYSKYKVENVERGVSDSDKVS